MMLYRFDKKLRLLIFNEIEKIEVAVRSAIVNIGSKMTGNPFWMTDCANFTNQARFSKTLKLIEDEYFPFEGGFHPSFQGDLFQPLSPFVDSLGDIAFRCNDQHLRQHQGQEDKEADSPVLRLAGHTV